MALSQVARSLPVSRLEVLSHVYNKGGFCPGTTIPETAPTRRLGINRFVLLDNNASFDTAFSKFSPQISRKAFDLDQTSGCSCEQIIGALGLGKGHVKYGCSLVTMEQ